MKTQNRFPLKDVIVPVVVMLAFWGVALWGFLASGYTQPLFMFGYIGTSLGVGLGLYATLPKKQKPIGRRLTLFLVGAFLIGFAVFIGRENTQHDALKLSFGFDLGGKDLLRERAPKMNREVVATPAND